MALLLTVLTNMFSREMMVVVKMTTIKMVENILTLTAHTLDDLNSMTVKDIKELIKGEDLKVGVKKVELIERLLHPKDNDFKIPQGSAHVAGD